MTAKYTQQSYMILGARGVGKTVFMHNVANRFEENNDWIVVRLNSNKDMLATLARKTSKHGVIQSLLAASKIKLPVLEVDMSKTGTDQPPDEEDVITELLKKLKENEKRLLVIVDEATNTESMKVFASAFQNFLGQKLPIYLLMTGLYENISSLKNEKNLTFLYRMPRILLPPLDYADIAANYRDVFQLSEKEAMTMALLTRGYSYAFQLLGDLTWENDGNYQSVQGAYRANLDEFVYDKIWSEMSDRDRYFAYCIATASGTEVSSIMERASCRKNEFSPYRDRLIKKEILTSRQHGILEFALPFFKGYVMDHYYDPDDIVVPAEL